MSKVKMPLGYLSFFVRASCDANLWLLEEKWASLEKKEKIVEKTCLLL